MRVDRDKAAGVRSHVRQTPGFPAPAPNHRVSVEWVDLFAVRIRERNETGEVQREARPMNQLLVMLCGSLEFASFNGTCFAVMLRFLYDRILMQGISVNFSKLPLVKVFNSCTRHRSMYHNKITNSCSHVMFSFLLCLDFCNRRLKRLR